ncbi:MAG: hotdog domain-containing protein, partial [Tepidisphaeraceae bacterium]
MNATLRPKTVSESAIHDQTAIVFPNDLNSLGTLFGGRVLEQADRVAAVVARRHSGRECVTLGIDSVRF